LIRIWQPAANRTLENVSKTWKRLDMDKGRQARLSRVVVLYAGIGDELRKNLNRMVDIDVVSES
jgi:hypothetical protein